MSKKNSFRGMRFSGLVLGLFYLCTTFFSCSENTPLAPIIFSSITIDPTVTHQEMIGFGGALTWYSDRVISSNNTDNITQLLFTELGADIIRFKNWYYPDGYPTIKTTHAMSDDNSKAVFTTTNTLAELATLANPSVKTLLSSWGPPAALKSNASTREGTLKKNANLEFMYDEFGEYWNDVLDHVPFDPDYISIQNEPSYTNSGWTTCKWAHTETADVAGYNKAFAAVAERVQLRTHKPLMVGPESANIGMSASGNTFKIFADEIKDHPALGAYAYHPYNFNSSTTISDMISLLSMMKEYNNKPNIMTEYSDNLDWLSTALFINNTTTQANSSGYIYWKMVWGKPTGGAADLAMVSIDQNGNYTVTPYYYLIKHFSKYIDNGYRRIDISTSRDGLNVSAFVNPDGTAITAVIINPQYTDVSVKIAVTGKTVSTVQADQSTESNLFKRLSSAGVDEGVSLLPRSITTVVLAIN